MSAYPLPRRARHPPTRSQESNTWGTGPKYDPIGAIWNGFYFSDDLWADNVKKFSYAASPILIKFKHHQFDPDIEIEGGAPINGAGLNGNVTVPPATGRQLGERENTPLDKDGESRGRSARGRGCGPPVADGARTRRHGCGDGEQHASL
jgi:hypothetical protein